jgi:hypothetical protein
LPFCLISIDTVEFPTFFRGCFRNASVIAYE